MSAPRTSQRSGLSRTTVTKIPTKPPGGNTGVSSTIDTLAVHPGEGQAHPLIFCGSLKATRGSFLGQRWLKLCWNIISHSYLNICLPVCIYSSLPHRSDRKTPGLAPLQRHLPGPVTSEKFEYPRATAEENMERLSPWLPRVHLQLWIHIRRRRAQINETDNGENGDRSLEDDGAAPCRFHQLPRHPHTHTVALDGAGLPSTECREQDQK